MLNLLCKQEHFSVYEFYVTNAEKQEIIHLVEVYFYM